MCKLYFKYGCMNASKSAQLLMANYNYVEQGKKTLVLKPSVDTREDKVHSRIGLEAPCIKISSTQNIKDIVTNDIDVILVDEAQFLTSKQVEQLYEISVDIPVLCYGLMTDFQQHLFEGSKRLVELAESLQEFKTVCKCGKKATINARIQNGKIVTTGTQIQIGGNERYLAMCKSCYLSKV